MKGYLNLFTFGLLEKWEAKAKLREGLISLMNQFYVRSSLEATLKNKDEIIEHINTACFEDLINPIEALINTTNNNIDQKAQQIENTISDISDLELKKSRLDEEYDTIKIMVEECYQN